MSINNSNKFENYFDNRITNYNKEKYIHFTNMKFYGNFDLYVNS